MPKKAITPLNEDFDFKLFVTIARKNAIWFFLFLTISFVISMLILRYTAPVYESSTTIKLASENKANLILGTAKSGFLDANQNVIAGDIELIRSNVIVERAVARLPLDVRYFAKGTVLENELYKQSPFHVEVLVKDSMVFGKQFLVDFPDAQHVTLSYYDISNVKKVERFRINDWIRIGMADFKISINDYVSINTLQNEINHNVYYFQLLTTLQSAREIYGQLNVLPLNLEANTIAIKYRDKNSRKSADIANAIASEFNKYDVEKNSEVANKILDFIDNTIIQINMDLSNSENQIEEFKRNNKVIDPTTSATEVVTQIRDLQTQTYLFDFQYSLLDKLRKEVIHDNDIASFILSISGNSENITVQQQLTTLQQLIEERDQILIQATAESEAYKSVTIKINSQKELLLHTLDNVQNQLISKKQELVKRVNEYESKFGKIPRQQAELTRLQRLFTINEKFYSLLLEKKAEFSITRAGYVPQHIILEEAFESSVPVSPNRSLILATCLMLGFLASFGLIIVRYLLYNEINALEEIGYYTEAALLGIVPKYKREIPVSQLLVDKNPKSVISEAFRSIRTNLQFISNETGSKIMAVTSTISGEGKTFNAINLAGVIAFSGKKVVILDLDMRKPKIHLGFNVENNHGISTLLIGRDKPEDCIIKSGLQNLDFITAGPIPPNPAELIISPHMDKLLDYLKNIYEIIIIDTPPVGIVSDGIPLIQRADYPIYILRANYSRKMFITQVNKLMTDNKVKNLSIILNGVEMSKLKYGYGYGYSYGYGYGYGYSYGYGYYEEEDKHLTLLDKFKSFITRKK